MQTAVWRSTDHFRTIGLPETYPECYALAIYVYTLDSPALYAAVNKEMTMPMTRQAASGAVSQGMLNCMPYIKLLDAALEALPFSFVHTGEVFRGVKWVYPSPDDHDPERHFPEGCKLL
eukprot:3214098-Pleurochrysis_carterae.AAC.1